MIYAHGIRRSTEARRAGRSRARRRMMERGLTGLDVVKALEAGGFRDIAENLCRLLRQRVSGDLLQTSAIIDSSTQPL